MGMVSGETLTAVRGKGVHQFRSGHLGRGHAQHRQLPRLARPNSHLPEVRAVFACVAGAAEGAGCRHVALCAAVPVRPLARLEGTHACGNEGIHHTHTKKAHRHEDA
jgi:hypothetical protein